jgi:hypothetical protein
MPTTVIRSPGFFARGWRWFKDQLVREVPPESAACEFECRKEQCLHDEWVTCEHRLSRAAQQLSPEQRTSSNPAGRA